jgi:hypothetical protein
VMKVANAVFFKRALIRDVLAEGRAVKDIAASIK